ncbi:lytic transglycosylase domain-containing protein [Acetobacter estunensis]|uniref:lytic transglycosylase domain-containing protein n=1 Tax=Acetobacter estunensis TaxID=104097 RepID=UPI001C2D8A73|nr:lytic transglycosylase domain-containing protein [Acetobacter estunensis]MBV1836659.1 lytic transglycosylase domain-containing protein [Acetobacter estunensis]
MQTLRTGRTHTTILPKASRPPAVSRNLKVPVVLGLLALLSACASQNPASDMQISVAQEEARYRAQAKSYYAPPGGSDDPWGPYITEASQRFDVPELWIRSVIQRESGGQLYHHGQLVTSAPGAMGLMQLMPPTYDTMRSQYNLGSDPYDPHNNILAGTAYIRQMYDIYGSPGFLAAYNAGPGRLEEFLGHNRTLPRETRNYVAAIGREIIGTYPASRSQADLLVASHTSTSSPAYAYAAAAMPSSTAASVRNAWTHRTNGAERPVEVAEAQASADEDTTPVNETAPAYTQTLPAVSHNAVESPQSVSAAWQQRLQAEGVSSSDSSDNTSEAASTASAPVVVHSMDAALPSSRVASPRFALVSPASASSSRLPARETTRSVGLVGSARNWAIQVGAFSSPAMAQAAATHARTRASGDLAGARAQIAGVHAPHGQLYRARLTGLSRNEAVDACRRLSAGPCVVVSPEGT